MVTVIYTKGYLYDFKQSEGAATFRDDLSEFNKKMSSPDRETGSELKLEAGKGTQFHSQLL